MENKTLIDELKAKIISLEGRLKESEFNIQEVTAIEEKYREDISKIKLSNKVFINIFLIYFFNIYININIIIINLACSKRN